MIDASRKRGGVSSLDKKMETRSREGRVQSMAMVLPIAGVPIHLDVPGFHASALEFDFRALEIRTSLAVPLAEMENAEWFAVRRCPLRAVVAVEKPRLDFQLPFARREGLGQRATRPRLSVGQVLDHKSG